MVVAKTANYKFPLRKKLSFMEKQSVLAILSKKDCLRENKNNKSVLVGCIVILSILATIILSSRRQRIIPFPIKEIVSVVEGRLSPDGSKIAFIAENLMGKKGYQLYILSVKSKKILERFDLEIGKIPFAAPPEEVMEWSPDSSKLLIKAYQSKSREGIRKYRLFLVNLKKEKIDIIDNIFPGRITQSWNKSSDAFLICRYSAPLLSFSIFKIGEGERVLLTKEVKKLPSGINAMWSQSDDAIYYWENGQGVYKSTYPYNRFEKIYSLPKIDATSFFLCWYLPIHSLLVFSTYLPTDKWRISILDLKQNKEISSLKLDFVPSPIFSKGEGAIIFYIGEPASPLYIWEYEKGNLRKIKLNQNEIPIHFEPQNNCLLTIKFKWEKGRFKNESYLLRTLDLH